MDSANLRRGELGTILAICSSPIMQRAASNYIEYGTTTVRVWKYTVFDFTGRRDLPSSRYARSETISIIGGTPIQGSDILVVGRILMAWG
jgi:hypothetical protein